MKQEPNIAMVAVKPLKKTLINGVLYAVSYHHKDLKINYFSYLINKIIYILLYTHISIFGYYNNTIITLYYYTLYITLHYNTVLIKSPLIM